MIIEPKFIRNFAIIAHIDHGKSTLADRLIEFCGGIEERKMKAQILDSLEIERQRGITIKSQTVRLRYNADDGNEYVLNLMDTPGHVDFSYEVSRSLAGCEGSILVVDAAQGVEAQTIANVYKAIDNDHMVIPVLNKVDLQAADIDRVKQEIEDIIGLETDNAVSVSAKTGIGIKDLLEAIVKHISAPPKSLEKVFKALLIDSWYDAYLGVIVLFRVSSGTVKKGDQILLMSTGTTYGVLNVGIFTPEKTIVDQLSEGEIGFIVSSIKKTGDCKIGDTITSSKNPCAHAFEGFKPSQQVVFSGLFPVDSNDFPLLRESIEKLHLNDSSFSYESESSNALGFGFRCGFLGMLHLEVIQERLSEEFNIDIIMTAPSVVYKIHTTKDEIFDVYNPADMPDIAKIRHVEEPWIKATIMLPTEYIGDVMQLCHDRRGEELNSNYSDANTGVSRAVLEYSLPLSEVVFDFYDKLKSISRGYASLDWEMDDYRESQVVRMQILINGDQVDALSFLAHKTSSEKRGRDICKKLKELIPRQQFKIALQATIGAKIIARETIQAYRKDVTAKLYGGDVTRKMKLLEKQKAGKKRMHQMGNVSIPQDVYIKALKID